MTVEGILLTLAVGFGAGLVRLGRPTLQLGGWWASIIGAIIVLGLVVAVAPRGRRAR